MLIGLSLIVGTNSYLKEIKNLAAVIGKDELVKSISKWNPTSPERLTALTVLNKWQDEALNKAIHHQFQLIQGPPGILRLLRQILLSVGYRYDTVTELHDRVILLTVTHTCSY